MGELSSRQIEPDQAVSGFFLDHGLGQLSGQGGAYGAAKELLATLNT
jgi:hypothetical protein